MLNRDRPVGVTISRAFAFASSYVQLDVLALSPLVLFIFAWVQSCFSRLSLGVLVAVLVYVVYAYLLILEFETSLLFPMYICIFNDILFYQVGCALITTRVRTESLPS